MLVLINFNISLHQFHFTTLQFENCPKNFASVSSHLCNIHRDSSNTLHTYVTQFSNTTFFMISADPCVLSCQMQNMELSILVALSVLAKRALSLNQRLNHVRCHNTKNRLPTNYCKITKITKTNYCRITKITKKENGLLAAAAAAMKVVRKVP